MNFSRIMPRLWTGGALQSISDVETLVAAGVTHVVDCTDAEADANYDDTGVFANHPAIAVLWNPTPDDGQPKNPAWFEQSIDFALMAWAKGHTGLYAHCFPPDVVVGAMMPAPISQAPRRVIARDGRHHKVSTVMQRPYTGDLITVCSHGNIDTRATPEHPFLVVRPYRFPKGIIAHPGSSFQHVSTVAAWYAGQPIYVQAAHLRPGDYLVTPRWLPRRSDAAVPWVTNRHPNTKQLNESFIPSDDLAWAFGLFIANGHTTADHYYLGYTLKPSTDFRRLVRVFREELGLDLKVVEETATYRRLLACSVIAASSFRHWFGAGSKTKKIPGFLWKWNLGAVLTGYLEGDGYVESGKLSVTTTSLILAFQLRQLLLALGERPYMHALVRHSGYENAAPAWVIENRPKGKWQFARWWNGLWLTPITEVTAAPYEGPVFNLEVQDDPSFLANGVVVHNCTSGHNRGPSTALAIMLALGFSFNAAVGMIHTARPSTVQGLRYAQDAANAAIELGYTKG